MQAKYTTGVDIDRPVREFPTKLCDWDETSDIFSVSDSSLLKGKVGYKCIKTPIQQPCINQTNTRCSGDPYSQSYYHIYGEVAKERRSTLFNIYAFDSKHTSTP